MFCDKTKSVSAVYLLLTSIMTLYVPNECSSNETTKCDVINLNYMGKPPECIRFTTTFESFFLLVDEEYWMRASRSARFQENISLAMYRYYMAQHLYSRLVEIREVKDLASTSEQRFSAHVKSIAPLVPLAIIRYLESIGDVYWGAKFFSYQFIIWPNENGDFEWINSKNHWMYMAFPAPVVLAQAIQVDLGTQIDSVTNWNLKDHLAPSFRDGNPGLPTANLLGWKPATVLTTVQAQNLHLSGINQYNFEVINSQFQFNAKLMKIIYKYLQAHPQATDRITRLRPRFLNHGGESQLGWLQRTGKTENPVAQTIASIERNMLIRKQTSLTDDRSQIFGFRVDKRGTTDWAIYSWNDYNDILESWNETKNSVFEFGDIYDDILPFTTDVEDFRDGDRATFLEKLFDY